MAGERMRLGPADIVVLALNPALVMGMVGSLVYFLLEVFYAGAYGDRMMLILASFVAGIVLITRIALTTEISDRASLYGLVLGGLVWVSMQRFVEYPEGTAAHEFGGLMNLGLMAVVWWSAHRLTKDCTHLEADAEIGNEGLLDAAGVNENFQADKAIEVEPAPKKREGFLERYGRYREKQRKKRVPGVWVVYFSLAALPIFGLGQALVPAEDRASRRYTFLLLCFYVACGLGLLLTTSFLGLRRYLRKRGAKMPASMTASWLTAGVVLILLVLGAAVVVPRPVAENSLMSFMKARSQEREASDRAKGDQSPGKDKGKPKIDPADKSGDDKAEKGKDSEKDKSGKGDKGSGTGSKSNEKGAGGKEKNSRAGDGKSKGEQKSSGQSAAENSPPQSSQALRTLGTILKWVVFALLALVVLFLLCRAGLRFLANFTDWARRWLNAWSTWWNRLFAREAKKEDEEPAETFAPPPFAIFDDPFLSGRADRLTLVELVNYSFQALEAWSAERHLARAVGETPLEFTRRVGEEVPAAEDAILALGKLYLRAAYAPGPLPVAGREDLRGFWMVLGRLSQRETRQGV